MNPQNGATNGRNKLCEVLNFKKVKKHIGIHMITIPKNRNAHLIKKDLIFFIGV